MKKKVHKNIFEKLNEERQEQLSNIKVKPLQTRAIENAEASLAAAEKRLAHLQGLAKMRKVKTWREVEPSRSVSGYITDAQKEVDIAKKNLSIAKKPPKKVSPLKKIQGTLRKLDAHERRTGRKTKRNQRIREGLERRLEALKT